MDTCLEITETAVPTNVRPIRHQVADAARRAGATGAVVEEVTLCVGEAVANAVTHAYDYGWGTVDVLVQTDELELLVTVRDRGTGLPHPGDEPKETGHGNGFGLRIIESLARDVSLWSERGRGTVVRMRFNLDATNSSVAGRSAQARHALN